MEVNAEDEYLFCFVGGSCGSFLKAVFYYYLAKLKKYHKPVHIKINPQCGDCHLRDLPIHHHSELNTDKKIICIDFDPDDKPTIIKMAFHKAMKLSIAANPNLLEQNWDQELAHIDPANLNLIEKTFLANPDLLIHPNWDEQMKKMRPVLTVKFKDIMFGNLNKILADFFLTDPLPELDTIIQEYRKINSKYLDN
jgi:hypothetical protein